MFYIGDIWYGRTGTDYEGVRATIINVNPSMVIVSFDRMVTIKGKSAKGKEFSHKTFIKLFDKKNEQLRFPFLKG